MAIEIRVPALGESVTEATVAKWFKKEGDLLAADDMLAELETDKVTLEVTAPVAGTLTKIAVPEGSEVAVGALLAVMEEGKGAVAPSPAAPRAPEPVAAPRAPEPVAAAPLSPAVRRMVAEHGLNPSSIPATGRDGRLVKGDVQSFMEGGKAAPLPERPDHPREQRVRMTRLRKAVARRLKEAQNTAAMLTTFNEIDMTNVMKLRETHKDAFEKRHGVRLGFMGVFVKAAIVGLKEFPAINAEIYGDEIIYKNHYDIGIAVGSPSGLVVPVVRDADAISLAGVESAITDFGRRARDGKLAMEDMSGGTFTITNGGVFGSMLSTPILNPPQSGILGMHKTTQRAVVMSDGSIQARPIMFVALSYDHRIVDGREAVSFLVRVKECVEDPGRILLEA